MGDYTGQPAPDCDRDEAMWLELENSIVVPMCKQILALVEDEAAALDLGRNVSARVPQMRASFLDARAATY